jgi:hypothetical protein
MSDPNNQDIANAALRQAIAARQNEEFAEVERLAHAVLGPEWKPWMALRLLDADHRQTGNTTPVATVFKVYRGEERLTENSVFIRRISDGQVLTAGSYEPLFADLLTEKHPTKTVEVKGQHIPVGRYELCWSALEQYHPRSAESLAAAREKREERAVEKEALANPLFADQIRAEGTTRNTTSPRGRKER